MSTLFANRGVVRRLDIAGDAATCGDGEAVLCRPHPNRSGVAPRAGPPGTASAAAGAVGGPDRSSCFPESIKAPRQDGQVPLTEVDLSPLTLPSNAYRDGVLTAVEIVGDALKHFLGHVAIPPC